MNAIHHAAAAGFAFGVGACVGSFVNVCVWRLPRGESLVSPPSRCPRCGAAISARDNLPVVGWLVLRGRCRACACRISARYPLVEGAVGFLFAAVVIAQALSGPLDPFDRGPLNVLAAVIYHWALVALLVTAALIRHDRDASTVRPAFHPVRPRAALLAASAVSLSACLAGDPVGATLNLALLAVFLRSASRPGSPAAG